jgi:signal peptidase II
LGRPSFLSWALFALLGTGVFVADQASKWAAVTVLTDTMEGLESPLSVPGLMRFVHTQHPAPTLRVAIDEDWFHFRYVENPGAAWGFLSRSISEYRTPFFLTLSVAAMLFILIYYARTSNEQKTLRVALGLVFGGAMGNFVDRSRLGYVIDFIDWHIGDHFTWPTFNIADAAITIGVILLLIVSICEERRNARSSRISV